MTETGFFGTVMFLRGFKVLFFSIPDVKGAGLEVVVKRMKGQRSLLNFGFDPVV